MEVAASGIAVASIAIQLADSIKKLSDFWKSVEAAPVDVQTIIDDLDLLCHVIQGIAFEAQHGQPDATLEKVLLSCHEKAKVLNAVAQRLQSGFSSTRRAVRKWTAFKSALKWDQLEQFQTTLDRLKSTLMLVLQNLHSRASRLHFQQQRELFVAVETQISGPSIENTTNQSHLKLTATKDVAVDRNSAGYDHFRLEETPTFEVTPPLDSGLDRKPLVRNHGCLVSGRSWKKALLYEDYLTKELVFGSIRIRSSQRRLHLASSENGDNDGWVGEYPTESQTCIIIRPAGWLQWLGISTGFSLDVLNSSIQGWKHTLSTFRLVPDDAPIFELCAEGNVPAVQHLLSSGKASARDTNTYGVTPLHPAAENCHFDLCKLLIAAGAEKTAEADSRIYKCDGTPLWRACCVARSRDARLEFKQAFIRLFLDTLDFSDTLWNGWDTLACLTHFRTMIPELDVESHELFELIVHTCSQDIIEHFDLSGYIDILYLVSKFTRPGPLISWLAFGPPGAIDIPEDGKYYNVLMRRIADESFHCTLDGVVEALSCNANPSHPCMDIWSSPRLESAISLSMYYSLAFNRFLSALHEAKRDVSLVFDNEFEQGILPRTGWTRARLQSLVDWEHGSPELHLEENCTICDSSFQRWASHNYMMVQPVWVYSLEEIKSGTSPDNTLLAVLKGSNLESDEKIVFGTLRESEGKEDCASKIKIGPEGSYFEWKEDILCSLQRGFLDESNYHPPVCSKIGKHATKDPRYYNKDTDTSYYQFRPEDFVCMDCWLIILGVNSEQIEDEANECNDSTSDSDSSSEHEFSPFLIHS